MLAVASVMIVGLSCGGDGESESGGDTGPPEQDTGPSGPEEVSVDFDVSPDDDFRAQLGGTVDADISGKGGSVTVRANGETAIDLSGQQFTAFVNYQVGEGETGTFRSIKTPQITYNGERYVSKDGSANITIDTFSDGTFEAAIAGEFGYKRGDTDEKLDTPLKFEGNIASDYEKQRRGP